MILRIAGLFLILALLTAPLLGTTLGAEQPGANPDNAIDLTGPQSYVLAPGYFAWFKLWLPGDLLEHGVVMYHDPATPSFSWRVGFSVWVYRNTITGIPQLLRLGDSTALETSLNTKYWRGYAEMDQFYYIRVVNNASVPMSYTLAWTGQTYPPPGLDIKPDLSQPQPGAIDIPVDRIVYPTDTPTPTVLAVGGGRTASQAPYLGEQPLSGILGSGDRSWVRFDAFGGGRSTGVTLSFTPVTDTNRDLVFFKIWIPQGTPGGMTLKEIGQGTMSGNPFGPKFWRGGADFRGATYVEIINDGDETIEWKVELDNRWPPAVR
jgi:hypothetical protein